MFKRNRIQQERFNKDMTAVMLFAEPMIDALIKKGYDRYLMSDYVFGSKTLNFTLKDTITAEKELIPVLNSILEYLNLPLVVKLKVLFCDDRNNDTSFQNKAGLYQGTWANRIITINISKDYPIWSILAIICHECTHFFMEYNNLNWIDTDLNERRTDMMACIIGFSKILSKGYKKIETIKYVNGIRQLRTITIGYLTDTECTELSTYIEYRRKLLVQDMTNSNMVTQRKKEIRELIYLIKRFNSQCDSMNPLTHVDSYKYINKEEQEELQKAIFSYSLNNYSDLVRIICEQLERANTVEETIVVLKKCEKLCAELQSVVFIFQKYFK